MTLKVWDLSQRWSELACRGEAASCSSHPLQMNASSHMMLLRVFLTLAAGAFLAGCAKDAKVTTVKPRLTGPTPAASDDRQARDEIQRAGRDAHANPLRAMDTLADSLEISTRQLEQNPTL